MTSEISLSVNVYEHDDVYACLIVSSFALLNFPLLLGPGDDDHDDKEHLIHLLHVLSLLSMYLLSLHMVLRAKVQ